MCIDKEIERRCDKCLEWSEYPEPYMKGVGICSKKGLERFGNSQCEDFKEKE